MSLNSPKTCGFALAHAARMPARTTNCILRERTETPHGAVETITWSMHFPARASCSPASPRRWYRRRSSLKQPRRRSPPRSPPEPRVSSGGTDSFQSISTRRSGRILLELPRDSTRALLMITQATGLGSNPIGIDRGSSGETYVARFDRDGDRVHLVLENWAYRVSSGDPDHARSVAEAFPPSTVAALPLVAEEAGKLLVDATDAVMRDWNDVVGDARQEPTRGVHRRPRPVRASTGRTRKPFPRTPRSTSR